ncbi:hypothetical protein [Bacteroides sp.]|uniref:hypothetical protein n=1 Tax=Bacteroides sp. TaxID=29523 RepID=UPI0026321626|nr:hypothetical protein [Bacteroides sp.]
MNQYIIIIDGTPFILKEDCIKNWDEISLSLKRNDFSGIIRSFSSKFEFTGKAYNLLLKEYRANYLKANAQIEIYSFDNNRSKKYLYGSYLDFGSMEYDDTTVYINAIDNSLAAKIKAKKSTQYEYPVVELKEEKALNYDRLSMLSTYNFDIDNDEYVVHSTEGPSHNANIDVYVVDVNPEIYVGGYIEPYHESDGAYRDNKGVFMKLIALPPDGLYMDLSCDISISSGDASFGAEFRKKISGGTSGSSICYTSGISAGKVYHVEEKGMVLVDPLNNDYGYIGMVYRIFLNATDGVKVKIENFKMSVYYMDKMQPEFINVIKPDILLNRLLKSINEEKEGYVGEIEYAADSRLSSTVIIAAESARNLKNAKIYTSFKKFSDWMETVFGYVPDITDNKIIFKKRTSLFHSDVQKKISYTGSDFNVKVNSSLIYSILRVGYDKQDYDSINGRDEFHFTNEYDTGITITDKALELISPLRADPYGIEFLVSKRGEDTTDSDSDNDTFFVGAALKEGAGFYELVRNGYDVTGIISSSSMYNAMFSPRAIIEANKEYIASFAKFLKFASSSGNSDIVINEVAENSDVELTDPLFTVDTLSISTADGGIPSDVNALVEVERNDLLYICFINELKYKTGRYEGIDYNLQIKSIN